jgi:hypothetical protein
MAEKNIAVQASAYSGGGGSAISFVKFSKYFSSPSLDFSLFCLNFATAFEEKLKNSPAFALATADKARLR